jgi:hypothetical protein
MKTKTPLALIALLTAPAACGAPPGDDAGSSTASALTPSGWNAAWDKPAPQIALGNQPFAVVQDDNPDTTTDLVWLNSNYTTSFSAKSGSGWTVPVNLSGTLYGVAAGRAGGGFPGEYIVGVAPSGSVWMNMNGNNLASNGGSWSGWFGLGGYAAARQPAVVVQGARAHVFVIGGNNQIWHTYGDPSSPSAWNHGWAQLPALPSGHSAQPSAYSLSAVIRGGNNVFDDWTIDLAVLGNAGTVWHMAFNANPSTWTGTWEQVPSGSNGNPALGVWVSSTDANTVDILESWAGGYSIYASSSPGSWTTLPVPQGADPIGNSACYSSGIAFTSSAPGQLDFYEKTASGALYHDHYGPSPSTQGGLAYCH